MKIVCTGGRDFTDHAMVWDFLNLLHPHDVYVGDCPSGLDELIYDACGQMGIPTQVFKADWDKHGKAAGPIRNGEMLTAAGSDALVFAFKGGRGTADCVRQAIGKNMIVCEVKS